MKLETKEQGIQPLIKAPEKKDQIILIVDDSAMNRALLADMIGPGYKVVEAENGLEGIAAMQKLGSNISVVLLDINMPEMDGFDVLAVMNSKNWINDIPVIMVTAETSPSYIERAYDLGVVDFINRPFDAKVVQRRVNNTIMLFAKQKALVGLVADQVYEREKANSLMISILSHIVEFRNGESGLHVLHVSTMTEILLNQVAKKTDRYKLTTSDISRIAMASSLHDIGKISIPDAVLNKPGRLTEDEFELMKTHTSVGAAMLADVPVKQDDPLVRTAYEICRWHHERYDGGGYPDGLKGDDIPISAQAVSLADVYDALTSKRVYKDAYTHEQAMEMILNGECGTFNPFLLECFVEIADDIHEQLTLNSLGAEADMEIAHMVDEAMTPGEAEASSRTLELLDYERMKYQFFASMSNELQYEYTEDPPMVVLSDWAEKKLGVPEVIKDPFEDRTLAELFGEDNIQRLRAALHDTTPEEPVVQLEFEATIDDEPRWLQVTAHANWSSDEVPRYLGSIGKMVDIHEHHEKMADLQRRATHDSLTGLLNHAYARKLVQERMKLNPEKSFVFIVVDMDKFKDVNDTYGHLFGDRVLFHMAQRLEGSVRGNDIVARVGGDEFFICMECSVDPDPLIVRVYETVIGEYDGIDVSVSMGVATAHGDECAYDDLFRSADHALYEVKNADRGGFKFADKILSEDEALSALSQIDGEKEEDIAAAHASRS